MGSQDIDISKDASSVKKDTVYLHLSLQKGRPLIGHLSSLSCFSPVAQVVSGLHLLKGCGVSEDWMHMVSVVVSDIQHDWWVVCAVKALREGAIQHSPSSRIQQSCRRISPDVAGLFPSLHLFSWVLSLFSSGIVGARRCFLLVLCLE